MTKVAHLTSVHSAFDVRIFHKECVSLARGGLEVVLIAPGDHDTVAGGVRIVSVPKPKTRYIRMSRTIGNVLIKALEENAGLYHFHDPELIPVCLLLKLLGKRVVYDVHEDVPQDILTKAYFPHSIRKLISSAADAAERLGARFFDAVAAVTPGIAQRFPSEKAVVIHNFPITEELAPREPVPYGEREAGLFYMGVISETRGIREMVQAMSVLGLSEDVRLTLAGSFNDSRVEAEVRLLPGWKRVVFLNWIERSALRDLLSRSRIGLLLFHPAPNHMEAYPNKLFEYMAAGVPVIASHFPMWREVVEGIGCGLVVDPLDPNGIAKAIRWLLEHPEEAGEMGRRGMEAVRSRFNWESQAKELRALYTSLIGA